MDLNI